MVPADPFRDEIAIDFPSTRSVIARLRGAFLGAPRRDRDETLRADVLVSGEEAYRGARLPLVVVLDGTCPECGGRGEVWTEPCTTCVASGVVPVRCTIQVTVPPGVADGERVRLRVRAPNTPSVLVEVRVAIRHLRV